MAELDRLIAAENDRKSAPKSAAPEIPRPVVPSPIRPLRETIRKAIERAVEHCGNVEEAAKLLGIAKNTLYRRLTEYRIEDAGGKVVSQRAYTGPSQRQGRKVA